MSGIIWVKKEHDFYVHHFSALLPLNIKYLKKRVRVHYPEKFKKNIAY